MSKYVPLSGTPTDKQQKFIEATQRMVAFGGGRGAGKSWGLRRLAAKFAIDNVGSRVLVICHDKTQADHGIVRPYWQELHGVAISSKDGYQFFFQNGSTIRIAFCELERDIEKFAGTEFDLICVNEAQEFTEYQLTFLQHRGVLKQPLVRLGVTVEYASPGYKYLKRVFVSKEYDPDENPDDYAYIPATISDNPFLLADKEDYRKTLDLLPDGVRKAFLFGDWNQEDGK